MNDRTYIVAAAARLFTLANEARDSVKQRITEAAKVYPRLKRLELRLSFLEIEQEAELHLSSGDNRDTIHNLGAKIDILRPEVERLQRRLRYLETPASVIAAILRNKAERLCRIGPRILQGVPEPKPPIVVPPLTSTEE